MLKEALLVFASQNQPNAPISCLALRNPVRTHPYASGSVLLSLSTHLTYNFPQLDLTPHPQNTPSFIKQLSQINSFLTHHPLHEFWCDSFYEAIIKQHAIKNNYTLYIVLAVTEEQFGKVMKFRDEFDEFYVEQENTGKQEGQNFLIDQVLKKITGLDQLPRKQKKIGYLNVSSSQLRTDIYQPIINVRALMIGQLFDNQKWVNYDLLKGNTPSVEQFLTLDGVIIPGSTNSVLDHIPAIQQMSNNLFQAYKKSLKLKIVGICYGHQLVSLDFGGKVIKKKRTDKIQSINFRKENFQLVKEKYPFLMGLLCQEKSQTLLVEHHEDYVEELPQRFLVLADSETSKIECAFDKQTGRILTFQSHPEYNEQYIQGYIQRIIQYQNNPYYKTFIKKLNQDDFLEQHVQSSDRVRKVISEFLNS